MVVCLCLCVCVCLCAPTHAYCVQKNIAQTYENYLSHFHSDIPNFQISCNVKGGKSHFLCTHYFLYLSSQFPSYIHFYACLNFFVTQQTHTALKNISQNSKKKTTKNTVPKIPKMPKIQKKNKPLKT